MGILFQQHLSEICIYTLNILEFLTQIRLVISRIWTNCNCWVIPVSCILYLVTFFQVPVNFVSLPEGWIAL